MADSEQLRLLRLDVQVWNRFVQARRSADSSWTANLRQADLRGVDLPGADLREADLTEADLEGAYLHRANLTCAKLLRARFQRATLNGVGLHGADCSGAEFRGVNLARMRLKGTDLRSADFEGADLNGAEIIDCRLEEAILSRIDLRDADPRGARLRGAQLDGAVLSNADLRDIDWRGVDLADARLDGAKFQGADLRRAQCRSAYWGGADLTGVDFGGADLRGARMAGARCIEADFSAADLRGAHLQQTDFSRANLSRTDLRHAILEGAKLHGALLGGVVWINEEESGRGLGSFLDLANCDGLEATRGFDVAAYLERAFKFARLGGTRDARQWPGLVQTTVRRIKALHEMHSAAEPSAAIIETIESLTTELMAMVQHNPDAVFDIRPRVFEEMVAEMLKSFGWHVELTRSSRDGGYDIYGVSPAGVSGVDASPHLIECKRYSKENKVGVKIVRELYGASIVSRPGCMLMLATTSRFTKDALEFGEARYDVKFRDYEGILEWINAYRPHPGGRLYLKDNRLLVPESL